MDTRTKIIRYNELSSVTSRDNWIAVVGTFDPLTVTQAIRLENSRRAGRKLLAIVLDEEGTLLTAEARAALIAALRNVDAVSIARGDEIPILAPNSAIEIVIDSEGEKRRTAEFVQFVLRRQGLGQGI